MHGIAPQHISCGKEHLDARLRDDCIIACLAIFFSPFLSISHSCNAIHWINETKEKSDFLFQRFIVVSLIPCTHAAHRRHQTIELISRRFGFCTTITNAIVQSQRPESPVLSNVPHANDFTCFLSCTSGWIQFGHWDARIGGSEVTWRMRAVYMCRLGLYSFHFISIHTQCHILSVHSGQPI